MADTVTITVDDRDYVVPAGMNLIDAISEYAGFPMPRFCYHDRLEPVGMCRMCMAEVEARGRWALAATCTMKVADGLKVRVRSETAFAARRMVLELLLVNHPLDCPVCDKGGECLLQDQTVAHGPDVGRSVEARRHWPKPLPISRDVLLDRERCIQCGVCARFCDEIAGERAISLIRRGGQTEISPAFDGIYDSHFAGNTCDICPVGALTSASFRFRSRPWEMERRPAISPWDACGANLWLDVRENVIRRAMPRENRAVNDVWISDRERFFAYDFVLDRRRLDVALVRNGDTGELEPASFDDAIAAAVEGLSKALADGKPVAGIGGTHLGCEEQYALGKFVRGVLGSNSVLTAKPLDGAEQRAAAVPTFDELAQGRTFFLTGDLLAELPLAWLRVYQAVRKAGATLLTLNAPNLHVRLASTLDLTCTPGQEALVVRAILGWLVREKRHNAAWVRAHAKGFADLRAQFEACDLTVAAQQAGADPARVLALAEKLAAAEDLVVYAGPGDGRPDGSALRDAAWNLALALGTPGMAHGGWLEFSRNANTRGARAMGLRPDCLPGGEPVADDAARARWAKAWGSELPAEPGLDTDALLATADEGRLGALVVIGSDLVSDRGNPWQAVRNRWLVQHADGDTARRLDEQDEARRVALERGPFLVVSELFPSETTKLADVVLPATCFAERAGMYVNIEGRVQESPAAVRPILGVRSDLDIINALAAGVAARLGQAWTPLDTEAARAEIRALVKGWADVAPGEVLARPTGRLAFVPVS